MEKPLLPLPPRRTSSAAGPCNIRKVLSSEEGERSKGKSSPRCVAGEDGVGQCGCGKGKETRLNFADGGKSGQGGGASDDGSDLRSGLFVPSTPSLSIDRRRQRSADGEFRGGLSERSPFERLDPNPDALEIAKMVALGLTLLPLRVAVIVALSLAYFAIASMYVLMNPPRTRVGLEGPMRTLTRVGARVVLFVAGFHRLRVYGDAGICYPRRNRRGGCDGADRNDSAAPVIMVSNHVSVWEVLYFMSSPHCPSFAFKSDCINVPIVGQVALNVLGGIKIERDDHKAGGAAHAILSEVRRRVEARGQKKDISPLLIFPEGTTSNGASLLRFRTGAFVPAETVLPVLVSYPHRRFSPAYESIYTSAFAVRTLSQFSNQMEVRYLEPRTPDLEERDNPRQFAENVRKEMAEAAGLPLCDAGHREKKEYHRRLAERLRCQRLGWVSNFICVNPKPLPEEKEGGSELTYIYSSPR